VAPKTLFLSRNGVLMNSQGARPSAPTRHRPKELTAATIPGNRLLDKKCHGGYPGVVPQNRPPGVLQISTRIKELTARVTDKAIERAAVTKEWVLRELLDNAELAKADGSWAARNRSLELVGKEIGMFGDVQPPPPPQRLEDLPTSILEQLLAQSEQSDDEPPVQ
jgi:hypothetical protein